MQSHTYLFFDGRCEEALKFYERAMGGKIEVLMPFAGTPAESHVPAEFRNKVVHARFKLGDTVLMASDGPGADRKTPQGFSVHVGVDTVAEAKRIFAALADGGTASMPIDKTFFAASFGMVTDRFGIPWMVMCEKEG